MADDEPDESEKPVEKTGGIKCPKCHCRHLWSVRDTDNVADAVRRYRVCRNCGCVVRTREVRG